MIFYNSLKQKRKNSNRHMRMRCIHKLRMLDNLLNYVIIFYAFFLNAMFYDQKLCSFQLYFICFLKTFIHPAISPQVVIGIVFFFSSSNQINVLLLSNLIMIIKDALQMECKYLICSSSLFLQSIIFMLNSLLYI